ncbi:MAG TPA: cation:proton antiporter [Myxococcota bacterium]|nr:cation:proton antiporter [Myxococcota bacterium]
MLPAMEVPQVLQQMAVVAGVAVLTAALLARVRLPTTAGLLLAGAVAGPFGAGLMTDLDTLEILAEIGVVLLLFTIGLEFSMDRIRRIARLVAVGGGLLVGLTIAATTLLAMALGATAARGLFFGFVFAMSSTAVILQVLSDRGELDSPHGRFIIGTQVFGDLCIVPMGLIVPVLAGAGSRSPGLDIVIALGKAGLVVAGTLAAARWLLPRLFARVDATRSREVFLMAVVGICAGTAWLTSLAGLSLALGAFLAGLVLADTEYRHRALGDTMSLRNMMASLFFISLGSMFDVRMLVDDPLWVLGVFAFLVLGKGAIATVSALAMKFPARVGLIAGAGLAQFGEFGFVLLGLGLPLGLVTRHEMSVIVTGGVLSMFLTPLIVAAAPKMTAGERVLRPLERLLGAKGIDEDEAHAHADALADHVVVAGYGVAGRVLVNALREAGIPHVVLELNAETVRRAQKAGEPVFYADVSSPEALAHARAAEARALVLAINDPDALRRGIAAARAAAPGVPILVRTRYFAERQALMALGATEVVTEEVEAGIEMLVRVLARIGVPRADVAQHVLDARRRTGRGDRDDLDAPPSGTAFPELAELRVETYLVRAGSHALGRTVRELELRRATGALMLGARRGGGRVEGLDADIPLGDGDTVYLVGTADQLARAMRLLASGVAE